MINKWFDKMVESYVLFLVIGTIILLAHMFYFNTSAIYIAYYVICVSVVHFPIILWKEGESGLVLIGLAVPLILMALHKITR